MRRLKLNQGQHRRRLDEFTEDMQQNWTQNSYARHYTDQYGFTITYGDQLKLYHKGDLIITLHSLPAIKEVARIYLNDMILGR